MKIMTYFGITLFSIFIQVVLMELFQERLQIDDNLGDLNITRRNIKFNDIGKINNALYYRTNEMLMRNESPYINDSLPDLVSTTTDLLTTVIEVLYDESVTEDTLTTEYLLSTTDYLNVTEITLFERKNSTIQPNTEPKNTERNEHCQCNLLYGVCDINCCCDSACTESELGVFARCDTLTGPHTMPVCISTLSDDTKYLTTKEELFCIINTNIPQKRNINIDKYDKHMIDSATTASYKWHDNNQVKLSNQFTKKQYVYGDPLWLLRNGTLYYMDLPSTMFNNYCSKRQAVKFLKEQSVKCVVKLADLEIIKILGASEETVVISPRTQTFNNSALNCSTVECIKWSVVVCDEDACTPSVASAPSTSHAAPLWPEPACSDRACTNIPLNIDYIFYYYDSRIINATIKLYIQRVSFATPFMTQVINVKFYLANDSADRIIAFSGNPGYIRGLPVLVSLAESNYSEAFLNDTVDSQRYFSIPYNKEGSCASSTITNNYIVFGNNKKISCRVADPDLDSKSASNDTCTSIESKIKQMLGFNNKMMISSLGNPTGNEDRDWLPLDVECASERTTDGEVRHMDADASCRNLVAGVSFVFAYADVAVGDVQGRTKNKILSARAVCARRDVSVDCARAGAPLTIDYTFIDVTKPPQYEYAADALPALNVRLPADFFFPSNVADNIECNIMLLIACAVLCTVHCTAIDNANINS